MDIRLSYKDKLQYAGVVHVLPAWLAGIWAILRLVCPQKVPMPSMQGSSQVLMVGEGWQVFFVWFAPTISPYWPSIQTRHQKLYKRCRGWRPSTLDVDWCCDSCVVRCAKGQERRWLWGIWCGTCLDSEVRFVEASLYGWSFASTHYWYDAHGKNIGEELFGTVMDISDKTKDNVKARVDQASLCNRPKLNILPPRDGKKWKKPPAEFVLTKPQRQY